jgi:hypothetical protein
MMHSRIKDNLLLYLDGNLPAAEMKDIRDHLSTCSVCAKQHDMLILVWRSESRLKKATPSPFLWTRLQARIKEYEQSPAFVWDLRSSFQSIAVRPLPALVVIAAVVVGIYLGSPRGPERYEPAESVGQLGGVTDELGLDQFDMLPPGTLGSTLIDNSHTQK